MFNLSSAYDSRAYDLALFVQIPACACSSQHATAHTCLPELANIALSPWALYDHMFQEQYVYEHNWEVGDIILMDQLITQHKREFVEPTLLEKRVLHRLTFMLNNDDDYVYNYNNT